MKTALIAALQLAGLASAQISEEDLRPKILDTRYPPLARAARVMGDVRLIVDPSGITAQSGPPLLRQAAIDNAKSLELPPGVTLTYHFVLFPSTTVPASTTVRKGDALDRLFLRAFGLKTEKVVRYNQCVPGVAPPDDIKVSERGVDVWINAGEACLMIETANVTTKV